MPPDLELCRELFAAFLRRYTADETLPNEVKHFQWSATQEFHTRFCDGEISLVEFGTIVDMIFTY